MVFVLQPAGTAVRQRARSVYACGPRRRPEAVVFRRLTFVLVVVGRALFVVLLRSVQHAAFADPSAPFGGLADVWVGVVAGAVRLIRLAVYRAFRRAAERLAELASTVEQL